MEITNIVSKQIWEDRYQKNGETVLGSLDRVARYCSSSDEEYLSFFNVMRNGHFLPAGRTMSNAGVGKDLTLNNCFVANQIGDSIDEIFDSVKLGAKTHQRGGGIGYDFSLIRPSGTKTSNHAIASGVVSFMEVFDAQTKTITQGSRRGANMGVLSIYHPDIYEYLEAKSYDEGKFTQFNLSVMIDDDFMIAVKEDENIFLHYPVYDNKGHIIYDESKWTHKKEIRARDLWDIIMKKAYNTGEYGVLFYGNMNADNNVWYIETIVATNPCFTGDMKLLTADGYKAFKELEGNDVKVININGEVTDGKVWSSGNKETIKLVLSNDKEITCTPDHRFITVDGKVYEAKDLKNRKLMPYTANGELKIIDKIPYVKEVKPNGIKKVYDFHEPNTNWGVVEGYIAHNCGEYVSGKVFGIHPKTKAPLNSHRYKGACNLGSLYLHNFVVKPFTARAIIDYKKLNEVIDIAVRFLDNIIEVNKFPYKHYKNYQRNMRTIGLGITGLADMLAMMNLKYGSSESALFVDKLMNFIAKSAYRSSINLAKEKGSFPFLDRKKFINSGFISKHIIVDEEWEKIADDILKYGIRNARILSVAPVGTMSLAYGNNCSSGLEPIFSLSYDRKVKIGGQEEKHTQIFKMRDFAYAMWLKLKENYPDKIVVKEDVFVTAMDLTVMEHLKILKVIAFHVDMSCSKTINIPTDYSFEDTKKVYMYCWENGIKGCTIFRPNPLRQGILITEKTKEKVLKRGQWKDLAKDLVYYKRKIYIGCGKINLFIGWSEEEKSIQDLFIKRSGSGGCEKNLETTIISMSGMLRLGGSVFNIEKAFEGLGTCPSFISARGKERKISKGNSCGMALLNEIKSFLYEMESNSDLDKFEESSSQEEYKCPECGEKTLRFEGGCNTCTSCGYSKCS